MTAYQRVRQRIRNIGAGAETHQGWWARAVRFPLSVWPVVRRQLWKHNALAMSSTLAYQTLFALIPVLVLSVLVLKSLGAIGDSKESVRMLLDRAGLSEIEVTEEVEPGNKGKGQPVALGDKIQEICGNVESKISVGTLGPVGVILLIWSAVALLATMEKSLNRVFGVDKDRSIPRRLFLYWSAMTLVPLILTAAFYLSRQGMAAASNIWGISWVLAHLAIWVSAPAVSILMLAAVYKFLPNTNVPWRTAIIGAVVAVPLWMIARWGFGLYVRHAANHLYGALGLIPVFLIWLDLSWLIVLFGMEVAYAVTNLKRLASAEQDENALLGPSDLLATALVVTRHYLSGAGPMGQQEIGRCVQRSDAAMNRILERLQTADIVVPAKSKEGDDCVYVPARPARMIHILEFLGVPPLDGQAAPMPKYDAEISRQVRAIVEQTQSLLGHLTLGSYVDPGRPARLSD